MRAERVFSLSAKEGAQKPVAFGPACHLQEKLRGFAKATIADVGTFEGSRRVDGGDNAVAQDTSGEERVLALSVKSQTQHVLERTLHESGLICRANLCRSMTKLMSYGVMNRVFQRVPNRQNAHRAAWQGSRATRRFARLPITPQDLAKLGEAVGLVANLLQQPQSMRAVAQSPRLVGAGREFAHKVASKEVRRPPPPSRT